MSRPIAIKKALPLLGLAANALRGVGTKVAAKVAEKGVGGALKEGAKAAVANTGKKDLAVGVMQANNQRAQMNQQKQQNQMSTAQDMADKAKASANVAKAFNFLNYLEQEEYEPFMKKVLALADTLPRTSENSHFNERIGLMGGEHDNARYSNDQTFKFKGKDTGLTVTQVTHALHEIYQQKNPDNKDRLNFTDMISTDEPHPRPAGMGNANANLVQVITDPNSKNTHITAGQTLTQVPEGVSQKTITPQGFFEQKNMLDMGMPTQSNQSNQDGSQDFLQQFYGGGKKNFQDVEDLVNRFSSREEDKLTEQLAAQDEVQEGRDYITEQNYNRNQQKLAEQKAREEEYERMQEEKTNDRSVTPIGQGMVIAGGNMMSIQEAQAAGFDTSNIQTSEPFDLAWQMLFKESVELHHDEELPSEFVNDVMMLDRTHKMTPTDNGTLIDNIDPFMQRTIELMAQNYKEEKPVDKKQNSMLFY